LKIWVNSNLNLENNERVENEFRGKDLENHERANIFEEVNLSHKKYARGKIGQLSIRNLAIIIRKIVKNYVWSPYSQTHQWIFNLPTKKRQVHPSNTQHYEKAIPVVNFSLFHLMKYFNTS